ncbi:MAG: thiamine pyrophosphate-binding protein [Pseudomonadota bacterium]
MPERKLGAQISHMLAARGVEVIFGIPGVHNQELYRGIEEAGITHVLARHEQGAGFMADGYARATGMPGICYVITGPGLTNALTPLGQAYSDSVPVLAISSCLDETAATRGQLHQMRDQAGAARAVCDWSEEARSAEAAYALIDRAFTEFETCCPRPKHLTVPIKLLESAAPEPPRSRLFVNRTQESAKPGSFIGFALNTVGKPLRQTTGALDGVARRLLRAERPVIIFGGGAVAAGGRNGPARRVLEQSKAASFMTYAGRGIAAPDDPLTFGSSLARPDSAKILDAADFVLIIGTDLSEGDLWRKEAGYRPGAVIVNIDPEVLSDGHPEDQRIQADALHFLADLAHALKDGEPNASWKPELVAGYRDRWRAQVEAERPGIIAVADALKAALPEATMIYSDMTQFAYTAKEIWDMDRPGHWHHPTGFGTLGYALPAAIGGAVARKGKPTMAIAGDYGFQYTLQELGTAVELGLPLPIFVWDNGKLQEIEESMVAAQIPPNAVVARNPDFLALARAYGAHAAAPKTLAEMQEAVRAAFDAGGPTLIHVTPRIAG